MTLNTNIYSDRPPLNKKQNTTQTVTLVSLFCVLRCDSHIVAPTLRSFPTERCEWIWAVNAGLICLSSHNNPEHVEMQKRDVWTTLMWRSQPTHITCRKSQTCYPMTTCRCYGPHTILSSASLWDYTRSWVELDSRSVRLRLHFLCMRVTMMTKTTKEIPVIWKDQNVWFCSCITLFWQFPSIKESECRDSLRNTNNAYVSAWSQQGHVRF